MPRPRFRRSDLVEQNPKLDVNALYRAGALATGQVSRWTCHWLTVTIRAEWERIWIDDQEVALARERFLVGQRGRRVRIKFLCSGCRRGCRVLHARGRIFVCRECAGYDYSSQHLPLVRPLNRLLSLRRRLFGMTKFRPHDVTLAYESDVAESLHDFVAELKAKVVSWTR
jgi:hypothetical protein